MRAIWIIGGLLLGEIGSALAGTPSNLPSGFRLIGEYKLQSKMKVEGGKAMYVLIAPLLYRVYSDGIDVRVYNIKAGEESYTTYQIYRSDGVGVVKKSGEIQLSAGVQAVCKEGDMIRQISVTRNSFTLVNMPPRSFRVIITRALAVKK